MARVETLTNRTIAQRFREIKDEETLWGEISRETQQLVKRIVETTAPCCRSRQVLAHLLTGRTGRLLRGTAGHRGSTWVPSYVVVAQIFGATIVTCDGRLARAVRVPGVEVRTIV